jgi:hypothetical protein
MSRIIVERTFPGPIADADLVAFAARQQDCLGIYGVTYLRSLLSQDRQRMMCEYDAPDVESVRRVQMQAEGPYDRVWAATILG